MPNLVTAKASLAQRELARRSFVDFARLMLGDQYLECAFTRELCRIVQDFAERVERKESPRFMISAPPRHGKTHHVTRLLPAWFLGRNPCKEFIAVTHSDDIATKNGGDVRDLLNSKGYKDLFNVEIDKSFNAKDFVKLQGGKNSFVSTTINSGLPGLGADIMCVDDYHRNTEDADSVVIRERIWNWWSGTASNRLMAGGGVLITATRWHPDDLQGRLLLSTGNWTTFKFPAIVDEAKQLALHPALVPWADLMVRKADSTARHFAALYLCAPYLDSGNFLRKEWVHYYDPATIKWEDLKPAIGADFASKAGEHNDHSGIVSGGIAHDGSVYIHPDIEYGKFSPAQSVFKAVSLGKRTKATVISVEKGTIANMMGDMFREEYVEQNHWMIESRYARTRSKDVHASGLAARMEKRKWFFPNTPWMKTVGERLLMQFSPAGDGEDDFIDALVSLEYAFRGSVKPPPPPLPELVKQESVFELHSRVFREELQHVKDEHDGTSATRDDW